MDAHKNFAYALLSTAPSGTEGTSLEVTVGSGALFPAAPFNITVWPANTQPLASNAEIMRVTAKATDTFTVTRAQEGTSGRTWTAGDNVAATVTTKMLTDAEYGAHGVINVKDPTYGALGDGVTDDTAAIQAAVAAAYAAKTYVIAPGGDFLFSDTIVLPDRVRFVGVDRECTRLVASSDFPADTPMVQLGEDDELAFGTRIETCSLIGGGYADIGIYSEVIQEQSGATFVHVSNVVKKCIHVVSATAQALKAQNYLFRDLEVSLATTSDSSAIAAHFDGYNNAGKVTIGNITVNVAGGVTDVPGMGVVFDGIGGFAYSIHAEHTQAAGVGIGINSPCQGLTLNGFEGHDTLNVGVLLGNEQNLDVTLTGIRRSNSVVTLQDDFTGYSSTATTLGFYSTGDINSGGVPNYPMVRPTTSSATLASGNNNDYALATFRVGTLRATADAATSTVTGIAGGIHNRELYIYNVSANDLILAHASASSDTANRINMPGGANVTLGINDVALLRYDGITARWRLVNSQI